MASADAKPFPIKNTAYRVTFPILDADGDLVAGAAGLDSEISKDGGTFTDCTNEATQIATSSGMYYLDLTATEMNADTVAIIIKTSTSGAKTTPIVMYPVENTDIPVNVKAISDDTTAADNLELMYDGTGYAGGTTKLEIDIVKLLGTAWLTPGVAGTPDVNTKLLGGTAQTGNDVGADVNDILTDTGTTLDALIKDVPTVAEFEARSILAADYVIVGDTIAGVTAVSNDVGITQAGADKVRASACVTGDPANSIGKILYEIYTNRLTSARAGYLANINNANLATIADISSLTATEIAYLNASISSRSSHTAANVWAVGTRALTDKAGFALSTAGINAVADQVWDELLTGAEHNTATSAGRRLRELSALSLHSGTAQAGTATTITLAAGADGGDGIYNRNLIIIVGGTGAGQTRTIADYNNTTKVCIIDRNWRINPDATSEYQILADDTSLVVDQGIAQAGTATTITLRDYASSINDTYLCNIIAIIGGTGRGQARLVGGYNGGTKVVTLCGDNWVTNPDNTSVYVMIPYGTTCTSCIGTYALSQINAEVDTALNTAIPASPVTNSVNERVKAIDILSEASGNGDLAAILADTNELQTDWANGGRLDLIIDSLALEATLTAMKGSGFLTGTDSLEAIRNRGDAAWVGGGSAADIADAVWDELQSGHTDAGSFGKYLDAAISDVGGVVGSGALSCTWTQKDEGGTAMDNVQVWISTDEAGNNVVAGTLITDASGEVTFMLDEGTYYVWRERGGYNFTNPQTWAVS